MREGEDSPLPEESKPEVQIESKADPEPKPEPEEDKDHRIAQLRKLKQQFVKNKDLEAPLSSPKEPALYRETKAKLVICPNCQSEEPQANKICSQCGAKLPNLTSVSEEKYNPGSLNKAVLKYYDSVEKLKSGHWTPDDFLDFLHERIELSESQIDVLLAYIEETGFAEWLPDATKLIKDSTLLLEDSIRDMLHKLEDTQNEQNRLELDFDNLMDQYDKLLADHSNDKDFVAPEQPEPPELFEERIASVSFQVELDTIQKSNKMMLDALKLIDNFEKQARQDLEVSL